MLRGGNRKVQVHRITEAPKPLSDDISSRQRKYAISMGIRAVAFIIAAVAPMPVLFRVLLIIASLVIPYVAVVYANGGRELTERANSPYEPAEPRAIAPTSTVPHEDHGAANGASNGAANGPANGFSHPTTSAADAGSEAAPDAPVNGASHVNGTHRERAGG